MTGLIDPSQIDFCPLCHFCPHPLGICCFIWAAAILLLFIALLAFTGHKYRCPVCGCRVSKRTKLCPDCGYNFITGEPPAYARHILNQQPYPTPAAAPAAAAGPAAAASAAPKAVPGPGEKACPYCRTVMPESAAFCIVCGQKQP
ncbi:MAG: hypothetical protein IJH59_06320 [Firmicutes bacterium]|nr:hypothetical protein [Bacillota bacterium]